MHFYLLIYLAACLLPSLLTNILAINSIYKEILLNIDWKFLQNATWNIAQIFVCLFYISYSDQYQLKEMFCSSHADFSQFTPIYLPKILENAPAHVLSYAPVI